MPKLYRYCCYFPPPTSLLFLQAFPFPCSSLCPSPRWISHWSPCTLTHVLFSVINMCLLSMPFTFHQLDPSPPLANTLLLDLLLHQRRISPFLLDSWHILPLVKRISLFLIANTRLLASSLTSTTPSPLLLLIHPYILAFSSNIANMSLLTPPRPSPQVYASPRWWWKLASWRSSPVPTSFLTLPRPTPLSSTLVSSLYSPRTASTSTSNPHPCLPFCRRNWRSTRPPALTT